MTQQDSLDRLAQQVGMTDVEFQAREDVLASWDMAQDDVEDDFDVFASWEELEARDEGRQLVEAMNEVEAHSAPLGW